MEQRALPRVWFSWWKTKVLQVSPESLSPASTTRRRAPATSGRDTRVLVSAITTSSATTDQQ